jgi:uncharacterized protein (DUF2147 family)
MDSIGAADWGLRMSSTRLMGALAGVAIALAFASPLRAEPSAAGLWEQVDENGRVGAWFHFAERGGTYEGRLVKAFLKPGEKPQETCTKCPGSARNAPIIGLTLIKGMRRKGRSYEDGAVLDPRDGSVYRAMMEVSPDGQKLMVRGYVGVSLLGRSQVWRRLPDSALAQTAGAAARP